MTHQMHEPADFAEILYLDQSAMVENGEVAEFSAWVAKTYGAPVKLFNRGFNPPPLRLQFCETRDALHFKTRWSHYLVSEPEHV
jgi:hypothetical protein